MRRDGYTGTRRDGYIDLVKAFLSVTRPPPVHSHPYSWAHRVPLSIVDHRKDNQTGTSLVSNEASFCWVNYLISAPLHFFLGSRKRDGTVRNCYFDTDVPIWAPRRYPTKARGSPGRYFFFLSPYFLLHSLLFISFKYLPIIITIAVCFRIINFIDILMNNECIMQSCEVGPHYFIPRHLCPLSGQRLARVH